MPEPPHANPQDGNAGTRLEQKQLLTTETNDRLLTDSGSCAARTHDPLYRRRLEAPNSPIYVYGFLCIDYFVCICHIIIIYYIIIMYKKLYGRLGKPAISFLRQLGLEAKEAGRKVSKSGFVAAAIREISVGLCRGNYQMYRASLGLLAGVSGRGFSEGAAHPTEEVL
jgi:hypothetical protein